MELLNNLLMGFSVALTPANIFFCFVGCLAGTLIGVLPGLGPTASVSLLLPVTFYMNPITAIIMLAGIYYGAMYGGSTTSILVNIPGEAASVVTCIDGYQMARQGRAGPALGMCAIGSFIAGTFSVVGLMLLAPPLAELSLRFGPPEYLALMVLGLALLSFLTSGSTSNAMTMAAFGLFLGTIGLDNLTGTTRFTFGTVTLMDGIDLVPVVMGLFGIGEVLYNLQYPLQERGIYNTEIKNLFPSLSDWVEAKWALVRGSVIGFFLGILPGGGAVIASFASYALEKRLSKTPEKFGKGAIAGVAGPESANNSATGGAFIPMMTLGLPANPVMAILMGALILHGIQPGPFLINEHPDLFWGVVTSMYVGNTILLILNLPLVGIWVHALRVRYSILFPLILLFCLIGAYSLKNNTGDMFVMLLFGVIGYLTKKYRYDTPPLVLALVLGPMMESALRRSLLLSDGSPLIFVQRPISGAFLVMTGLLIFSSILPAVKKKIKEIPLEEGE